MCVCARACVCVCACSLKPPWLPLMSWGDPRSSGLRALWVWAGWTGRTPAGGMNERMNEWTATPVGRKTAADLWRLASSPTRGQPPALDTWHSIGAYSGYLSNSEMYVCIRVYNVHNSHIQSIIFHILFYHYFALWMYIVNVIEALWIERDITLVDTNNKCLPSTDDL